MFFVAGGKHTEKGQVARDVFLVVNSGSNITKTAVKRNRLEYFYVPTGMLSSNECEDQNKEAKLSSPPKGSTQARRHSTCSYVPRHAVGPAISKDASPNDSPRGAQEVSGAANAGFVGLTRRRKTSLPSPVTIKPDQFLEGGRVEVAKREVNLEACIPVFTKEHGAARKGTSTAFTKSKINGRMFGNSGGKMGANQGPRQRRVSLPVLSIDKTDSQGLSSCNSGSSSELNNNFLAPIPRVRSASLVSKKAENRPWTQGF